MRGKPDGGGEVSGDGSRLRPRAFLKMYHAVIGNGSQLRLELIKDSLSVPAWVDRGSLWSIAYPLDGMLAVERGLRVVVKMSECYEKFLLVPSLASSVLAW